MIYFITGGQRSGKSGYAQQLALSLSDNPVYIATSRIWDEDFRQRVERHRSDRDGQWTTIEEEKYLSRKAIEGRVVVIDCVTLWLTNFFVDCHNDVQESVKLCCGEFDQLLESKASAIIIISNELGMGIHAATEAGRKFTDAHGWVNQHIARKADQGILMVSGIPVKIKG